MAEIQTSNQGGGNGGTTAVVVISLLVLGVAGYFVWKGLKVPTKKDGTPNESDNQQSGNQQSGGQQQVTEPKPQMSLFESIFGALKGKKFTTTKNDISGFTFPIRKGQKGDNVKKLQLLLLQYDKNILPKYGADSDFGSETESALIKVIGKGSVTSQDDIDTIKALGIKKGIQLGLKKGFDVLATIPIK